jgi:hypothetical protein
VSRPCFEDFCHFDVVVGDGSGRLGGRTGVGSQGSWDRYLGFS